MTARCASVAFVAVQILTLFDCSTSGAEIRISDAWASEAAGAKAKVIAGFMCIQNDGSSPIRILGASSASSERVEIHEIVHEQGIVRMKKIDGVDIAPHSSVCLEPEHIHFMLIGIDDAIRAGADIQLEIATASGQILHAVLPQRMLKNME